MSLEGKHILLGVTGSIAAYKAAVLCRLLKTAGADVRVVKGIDEVMQLLAEIEGGGGQ